MPEIAKFGVKFPFYVFNDKNIALPEKNSNKAIFVGTAQKELWGFVKIIEYAQTYFKYAKLRLKFIFKGGA